MGAEAAIDALTTGGELRTWSLIVTIFGDLARAEGAEISGPVLSALTRRVGVRPEAMRVALHRLRKDGWIETRRDGRVSHYQLTDQGRQESERATGRIYAAAPTEPQRWHLLIARPLESAARHRLEARLEAGGHVPLAPGIWLGAEGAELPEGLFVLSGEAPLVPDWLRAQLMPEALADAYAGFNAKLDKVEAALARSEDLSALERAALRVLIVHGWRRLVLRHADLPDRFFPADWQGAQARARVQALLATLGHPALDEIGEAVG